MSNLRHSSALYLALVGMSFGLVTSTKGQSDPDLAALLPPAFTVERHSGTIGLRHASSDLFFPEKIAKLKLAEINAHARWRLESIWRRSESPPLAIGDAIPATNLIGSPTLVYESVLDEVVMIVSIHDASPHIGPPWFGVGDYAPRPSPPVLATGSFALDYLECGLGEVFSTHAVIPHEIANHRGPIQTRRSQFTVDSKSVRAPGRQLNAVDAFEIDGHVITCHSIVPEAEAARRRPMVDRFLFELPLRDPQHQKLIDGTRRRLAASAPGKVAREFLESYFDADGLGLASLLDPESLARARQQILTQLRQLDEPQGDAIVRRIYPKIENLNQLEKKPPEAAVGGLAAFLIAEVNDWEGDIEFRGVTFLRELRVTETLTTFVMRVEVAVAGNPTSFLGVLHLTRNGDRWRLVRSQHFFEFLGELRPQAGIAKFHRHDDGDGRDASSWEEILKLCILRAWLRDGEGEAARDAPVMRSWFHKFLQPDKLDTAMISWGWILDPPGEKRLDAEGRPGHHFLLGALVDLGGEAGEKLDRLVKLDNVEEGEEIDLGSFSNEKLADEAVQNARAQIRFEAGVFAEILRILGRPEEADATRDRLESIELKFTIAEPPQKGEPATIAKPEGEETESGRSPEEHRELAKRAIATFLEAQTIRERLALIRDRERVRQLMERYYSDNDKPDDTGFRSIEVGGTIEPFIVAEVEMEDFSTRSIAVEYVDGEYLVDWESFVRYSEMSWDELKKRKPVKNVLVRAFVEVDNYYNYEFDKESEWACVRLIEPGDGASLYGYARLDSAQLDDLLESLTIRGRTAMTLRIAYPKDAKANNQILVKEVVAAGWVIRKIKPEPKPEPKR